MTTAQRVLVLLAAILFAALFLAGRTIPEAALWAALAYLVALGAWRIIRWTR